MTDIELYSDLLNNFSDEDQETDNDDSMLYCCYAKSYYDKKEYDEMKKYYLIAIEKNNINAMIKLGQYYHKIEINRVESEKYYLMAIKYNNLEAMAYATLLYCDLLTSMDTTNMLICIHLNNKEGVSMAEIEQILLNYVMCLEKANKYYEIYVANDTDNTEDSYGVHNAYKNVKSEKSFFCDYDLMFSTCIMLQEQLGKYDLMKKYCKLAIKYRKSEMGMYRLGKYYYTHKKNYEKMKKYFLMAIYNNKTSYCKISKEFLIMYYKFNLSQYNVNDAILISNIIKYDDDELYFINEAINKCYIIDKKRNYYSLQKYFDCYRISKLIITSSNKMITIDKIFTKYNIIILFLYHNKILQLPLNILTQIINYIYS